MTKITHILEENLKDSNPFADYVWMVDMEKFDREIEAQIEEDFEEEEFIRSCVEQLLDEEEERDTVFYQGTNEFDQNAPSSTESGMSAAPNASVNENTSPSFSQNLNHMYVSQSHLPIHQPGFQNGELIYGNNGAIPQFWYTPTTGPVPYQVSTSIIQNSTLNPNAAPFIMNPPSQAKMFGPRYFGDVPDVADQLWTKNTWK